MQVPAPFEYERVAGVAQAIALLERLGSTAKVIAGGQSLLPMMKLRLANFEYLVDINDLHDELGYIVVDPGEIRIGAMTRHRELLESDELAAACPIFRDAEQVIADPLVRNRGTLGGALCQADPSEDLSAVCTTLDARCVIRSSSGTRVLTMEQFYRGPYETAVGANELLIEIRLPRRAGGSSAYEKVDRRAGDWAIVSAGAAVWLENEAIVDARIGLAAVGPRTIAVPAATDVLIGHEPSEELFAEAGRQAAQSCRPGSDMRGSAAYKSHLADELSQRALRRAVARAREQT
jgi:carbon-monoxide dehydrogenase medium subunit